MVKNKSTVPKHITNKLASRNTNAPTIAVIPEDENSKQEATFDEDVPQESGNPQL